MADTSSNQTVENRKIVRASGVFGLFTLLSRILGLVRDQLTAYLFGAGPAADAFFVALRLPNLFRRISAEGAMSSAFVPVYTEVLTHQGQEEANRVAGAALGALTAILAVVAGLGVWLAPELVSLIAPGFATDPGKLELTVRLTRITFPYILLISMATLLMGQLNSLGHFAAPAGAPALLNAVIICSALILGPHLDQPAVSLAVGFVLGGLAQLLLQWPFLRSRGALPTLIWNPNGPAVRKMARRMVPVIFGAAAYQINLVAATLLASLLPSGSVSFLYYADRLIQFPMGVFGVALGTAVLPSLSRQAALGREAEFAQSTAFGFRFSLFIIVPSALGLALLAGPLISLIFQYGRFDALTATKTSYALWAYAPGLPLMALATVFTRAFNALGDTKTPAQTAAVSVAANIALSLILMGPLAHAGLALASSLAAGINLAILWWKIRIKTEALKTIRFSAGLWKTTIAGGAMGLWLTGLVAPGLGLASAWPAWLQVLLGVTSGAGVYFVVAKLLRCREMAELADAFRKKLGD